MVDTFFGVAQDAFPSVARRQKQIVIPAGETGTVTGVVYHADGIAPYLTPGCQLLATVWRGSRLAPLISKQCTPGAAGAWTLPVEIGDTLLEAPDGSLMGAVGGYDWDLWLTDTNFTPNLRFQVLKRSPWNIGAARGQPNQLVTVSPSQEPLATGADGADGSPINWRGVYDGATVYSPLDAVSYTTGGVTSSYVCILASAGGNLPTDATYWDLMAEGAASGGLPSGSNGQFIRQVAGSPAYVTLTLDMIAPAFAVALAGGFTATLETGDTLANPQFTDAHNQTPTAASLQDPNDTQSISPVTALALGYGGAAATFGARSYTRSPTGGASSVSWTYSATAGGIIATASASAIWVPRVFYETKTPATLNAAFIASLAGQALASGFARTISFGAGSNTKKLYYAFPAWMGTPSSFRDTATGFGIPFSLVASNVSVTNAFGVVVLYNIWASDNFLSAAVSAQVS